MIKKKSVRKKFEMIFLYNVFDEASNEFDKVSKNGKFGSWGEH